MLGWTYDLEGVGDNANSHELLSVVTAIHHQRVGKTLNDGALGLSESLLGVTTSRVGDVDWCSDLNVITGVGVSWELVRMRSVLYLQLLHLPARPSSLSRV